MREITRTLLGQGRFNFIQRAIPQIPPRNPAKTNFRAVLVRSAFIASRRQLPIHHFFLCTDKNILSLSRSRFHRKFAPRIIIEFHALTVYYCNSINLSSGARNATPIEVCCNLSCCNLQSDSIETE